jgi:hypothetical protein
MSLRRSNVSAGHTSIRLAHPWLLAMCITLAFLVNIQLPRGPSNNTIDSSWSQVLLHALLQHKQWGSQLSFTYGPLGFITPYQGYISGYLCLYLTAQAIFAALFAASAWYSLRQLPLYRLVIFAGSLAVFGFWVPGDAAWLSTYALSIIALSHIVEKNNSPLKLAFSILLVGASPAVLPLVKATLFIPWLAWIFTGTLICVTARQPLAGLCHLIIGIALPAIAWHLCGQDIGQIANFLHISLEIAQGYADAMQLTPNRVIDEMGILSAFMVIIILSVYVFLNRHHAKYWLITGMFLIVLFCSFKLSFTRADWLHLPIYPTASLIAVSALPSNYKKYSKKLLFLYSAIIFGAIYSLTLMITATFSLPWNLASRTLNGSLTYSKLIDLLHFFENPHNLLHAYDLQAAEQRKNVDLPEMRSLVGSEPVDVMSYQQGIAYANNMNLVFRPTFQSYSAYTSELMERNDAFYDQSTTPKWVIYKLQTIDHRMPSEDDAILFSRIATSYMPVLAENGFLLLKRQKVPLQYCEQQRTMPTILPIETWLKLPYEDANNIKIQINLKLSWKGKLKAFFFRPPIAVIEIKDFDGKTESYRLIRSVATRGFMLSPPLSDTQDYLNWRMGLKVPRVDSFRVYPLYPDNFSDFSKETSVSILSSECKNTGLIRN